MSSGYRLAPALAARLVGLLLVALAATVLLATLLVAMLRGSPVLLLVVGGVGLVAAVALVILLRGTRVVELDEEGYRVRMVRGAGVRTARWRDVREVVAMSPRGVDCVVLRLRDGRTTTIPVDAVDAPRDDFVRDLQQHLRRGEGLRPL